MYAKKRLIDMNIESDLAEIRKAEQQAEIDKMLTKKGLALGQDILAQQALGEAPTAYEAVSEADKKRSKNIGQIIGIAPMVEIRKKMKKSGKDLENVVTDLSSSVIGVHGGAVTQYFSGTAGKSPETLKEFTMYKQYLDNLDTDRLSGAGKYKYDSLYEYLNEYIDN